MSTISPISQSRLVTPAAIAGLHNGFAERLIGLIRRECVDAPLPYASLLPYAGSEVDRSSKGCGAQYGTRDQRRYDITDKQLCPGATEWHPRETQDAAINGDTIA
jgi:hypothetical protein